MMTFDEFMDIVNEEMALLPEYVFENLNGGVVVDPAAYLHPARAQDDLYILGTYTCSGILGRQILLYYGSFMVVMGNTEERYIRLQIRRTLRHEFLHHLETNAGITGRGSLAEEDHNAMIQYFESRGVKPR